MFNDPLHRTSRDMQSAAQEGGFWHMVQDTTAALNRDRGAFRSAANFQKAIELADDFVSSASPDDELWGALLEGMCQDDCDDTVGDYGTHAYGDRKFRALPFASCFETLNEGVKWCRWGSHHWGMMAFLPKRHRKLLVLCVQVIQYGRKLSDATMLLLGLAAPGGRCSGIATTCNLSLVVVVVFAVGVLVLVVQHVLFVLFASDVVHGVVFCGSLV